MNHLVFCRLQLCCCIWFQSATQLIAAIYYTRDIIVHYVADGVQYVFLCFSLGILFTLFQSLISPDTMGKHRRVYVFMLVFSVVDFLILIIGSVHIHGSPNCTGTSDLLFVSTILGENSMFVVILLYGTFASARLIRLLRAKFGGRGGEAEKSVNRLITFIILGCAFSRYTLC